MRKYITLFMIVLSALFLNQACFGQKIFTAVEKEASFPGGEQKMLEYLGSHISYPPEALQFGIDGMVYIEFVVDKDGSIAQPKILRAPGYGLEDEVMHVVKNMPNWIPAENGSEKVRCYFTLPVSFEKMEGGYDLSLREKAMSKQKEYKKPEKEYSIPKPTMAKLDSAISIWKNLASQIENEEEKKDCINKLESYRKCNHTATAEVDPLILMDYFAVTCNESMTQSMQYLKENDLLAKTESNIALELFMEYAKGWQQYLIATNTDLANKMSDAEVIASSDVQALYSLMNVKHATSSRISKFWNQIKPIVILAYAGDKKKMSEIKKKLASRSIDF